MITSPDKGNEYQWQSEKYGDAHVSILENHPAMAAELKSLAISSLDDNRKLIQFWWIEFLTLPHRGHHAYAPQSELFDIF